MPLRVFQNYMSARDGRGEVLFREAEDWILEENSHGFFTFGNICEVLGLDPRYVRQRLLRWKEIKLAERLRSNAYLIAKVPTNQRGEGQRIGPAIC